MDRITTIDGLIKEMIKLLPCVNEVEIADRESNFMANADRTKIFSTEESEIEALANFFNQLYEDPCIVTGYYESEDTRLYYLSIA